MDSGMNVLKSYLAILLCSNLCVPATGLAQSSPAASNEAPPRPVHRSAYQDGQLKGDARILHALNRFTFGPRPGDLEAVRRIGLEAWFERQLRPASIDETDLNARLAQFPAMQWSTQDLLYRIPSNAIIRQAIAGKAPVPDKGTLHAVYENQMYRVEEKKAEQAQQKADAQPAPINSALAGAMAMDARDANAQAMKQQSANGAATAKATDSPVAAQAAMQPGAPAPADDSREKSMLADLLALAPEQRVSKLQAMQPADFYDFIKPLKPAQRSALAADLNPGLKEALLDLEDPQRLVNDELIAQRLTRDIYSDAQLQEVMADFWLNHFNVFLHKNDEAPYYLVSYERDVIRPLALGKFEDLLEAVAQGPEMMSYLDNASSVGPDSIAAERAKENAGRNPGKNKAAPEGLNENYARELMELHTLGVNGGYTQADVTQVARVLTGWTVDKQQRGGGFVFNPNRHEPGAKRVMGTKIKENGELEGEQLLHFLATRPATAQFLSRKLAVRFVSDDPPQVLVDRMAKTYLSSGGDISSVMKTLFHSPEFWAASDYRAKVKTPIEFVVSAARATNADVENFQPLANALRQLGMPLYGCVPPIGYNWRAAAWVSTGALVDRMNFALNLAADRLPGIAVTWSAQADNQNPAVGLAAASAPDADNTAPQIPGPQAEETRLEPLLVPGGVSEATRAAALQQFEAQSANDNNVAVLPVSAMSARPNRNRPAPTPLEKQDQLLAGLLIGSPEFQRR